MLHRVQFKTTFWVEKCVRIHEIVSNPVGVFYPARALNQILFINPIIPAVKYPRVPRAITIMNFLSMPLFLLVTLDEWARKKMNCKKKTCLLIFIAHKINYV